MAESRGNTGFTFNFGENIKENRGCDGGVFAVDIFQISAPSSRAGCCHTRFRGSISKRL